MSRTARRFRRWATLGTVAAATTAALVPPSPAFAAGGCSTYTPQGHSIGICIDNRGVQTNAYPDYYVNNSQPAGCNIVIEIWDDQKNRYGPQFHDSNPCAVGHHPASGSWCNSSWGAIPLNGVRTVHAYFRLTINGTQVNNTTTNSPPIQVTFDGMHHC